MIVYESSVLSPTPGAVQFENANEGRSYPFADNAVLKTVDGTTLGDHVVADMHLVVPRGVEAYLSSVYISEHLISVCVRIVEDGASIAALSCMVSADRFEPYVPYRLEKSTGGQDIGGIVTFGAIDLEADRGTYRFKNGVPLADAALVKYVPAKLRRFIDDRTGESLSGDVDIEFSGYVETSKTGDGVKLSLSPGAEKALLSKCDRGRSDNPCGATPVASINGVLPDDKKRIVIWFH